MENEEETPQQIVQTTHKIIHELKPQDIILFLGRDSIPHYTTARKFAEHAEINRNNIKLIQTGRFIHEATSDYPSEKNLANRTNLEKHLKTLGLEKTIQQNGKIIIIDTGISGSQVKALEKILHSLYKEIKTEKKLVILTNPYIQGIELNVPDHLKEDKIKKILEKRERKKTPLETKKFLKKYHLNAKTEKKYPALDQIRERQQKFKEKAMKQILKIENLPKLTPPIKKYNEKGKPVYQGEPHPNLEQYKKFNQKLNQNIQKQLQKNPPDE